MDKNAIGTLNRQQTNFVLAFVAGLPLPEAGRLAGYREGQAYRVIRSPGVLAAISLLEGLHQLGHGVAVAKKREMLMSAKRGDRRPA